MSNTKCPPPYEWLLAALEKFAGREQVTRATACCMLLDRGLSRDTKHLRVLRTFPIPRGNKPTEPKFDDVGQDVPAFSVGADYQDLYDRVESAIADLRTRHIERSRSSMAKLVKSGLSDAVGLRGWRSEMKVGKEAQEGIVVQFVGDLDLPDEALRDVCDVVTDDMTSADVRRAIWAAELDLAGYAPKGWADRVIVNRGWLKFEDRVVR